MKNLAFLVALLFMGTFAGAQDLKVYNGSNCTIEFYLSADGAGCSGGSVSSVNYSIAPGAVMYFTFSTTAWLGTAPSSGDIWSFIKEWNACGPYNWVSPDCSGGANYDVCAVGTPCSGIPLNSCMKINTACNTCNGVKTTWKDYPSGDVSVIIN